MTMHDATHQSLPATGAIAQAFCEHLLAQWHESEVDCDIDTALAGSGIDRAAIESGTSTIRLSDYFRALRLAAPLVGDSGFFLRLGSRYNLFDLGMLGYALYSAPNLRRSWDISLGQTRGLVPHPIVTRRRVQDDLAGIALQPTESDPDVERAFCEEWLAGTWRWMGQRLPQLARCDRMTLHLAYPAPSYRHLYQAIFPGHVRFNMAETALWVPIAYYESPFASANASLMRLCYQKSLVSASVNGAADDLAAEIRFFLFQNAQIPFPDLAKTARAFRLPAHTLHRRLARYGTTFRQITLEVKMTLARKYLQETTLSIDVISDLLGYGQNTSFVRAFRRWHGQPPNAFRKQALDPS